MVSTEREAGQEETKPETKRLLTAADYFLQNRNFADCCKYAARARDSDPTHHGPARILSIASVLSVSKISPTQHDYYAVLNLPYFDNDVVRIGSKFKSIASILDPKSNPYPFSPEAFDLVLKAWTVLSNPVEKEKFDNELRMSLSGGCTSRNGGGTFWTMCPYCYYLYEYDKVFEDCCLRCANEGCRRVLHAVAIGSPPPPDVVEKGQYLCPGFMPFEICNSNEKIGEKPWLPFSPSTVKACDHNPPRDADYVVLDDETIKGNEFQKHGNGGNENDAAIGEKLETASESITEKSVNKMKVKRKKSVPWNSKKVMGRGIRIDSNEAQFIYGVAEERHSNGYGNEGGHLSEMLNNIESGVEFFEGDDDVLVGLPSDFGH